MRPDFTDVPLEQALRQLLEPHGLNCVVEGTTVFLRSRDPGAAAELPNPLEAAAGAATTLPLVTGYLAFHRIGMSPAMLLAIHILSVELLMVVFPFTKLMHAFTLFMARYYNGAIAGYRGVNS